MPDDMILVPEGEFQMGCGDAYYDGCPYWATPLHLVYLDPYLIDKFEVTNQQYAQCVTARGCTPPNNTGSYSRPSYYDNPSYADYPVIELVWSQAYEYCVWANKRLPSEAEWEKAARGANDTRAFPWGDQYPDCTLANYKGDSGYCVGDTSQVGSYPAGASPYGAMDMSGNVMEWVNDWFQLDYYSNSPYDNPTGPDDGTTKVLRGGSWFFDYSDILIADRFHASLVYDASTIGFRCAVDAP